MTAPTCEGKASVPKGQSRFAVTTSKFLTHCYSVLLRSALVKAVIGDSENIERPAHGEGTPAPAWITENRIAHPKRGKCHRVSIML